MQMPGNPRPRQPVLTAGACLVLTLFASSCGGRAARPDGSAPKQELEVLFRHMQADWNHIFTAGGAGEYRMARLEFFDGEKETPCGKISGGPRYCPENRMISAERGWLEKMEHSQPGAAAYLLARALARHVQHQLTIDERVEKAIASDPRSKDDLLRKRELQADCFVGLWRRYHERAEPQAETLKQAARWAAAQNADPLLASTLEERLRWFGRGLEADEIAACNVFAEAQK